MGNSLILLIMIIISSGYALYAMNQIGSELDEIIEQDIPITRILTKVTEHQLEQTQHAERAMRYGILLKQEAQAPELFKQEIAKFEKLSERVGNEFLAGERLTAAAAALVNTEEKRIKFTHIAEILKTIAGRHQVFEVHVREIFSLLDKGQVHKAELKAEKLVHTEEQLTHDLEALLGDIEAFTEEAGYQAAGFEHTAIKVLAGLSFLAIIIGVLTSWVVSRNVVIRLGATAHELETIASGDLTHHMSVEGSDEISELQHAMQTMVAHLLNMISQINVTTTQLSTAADQVSVVTIQSRANIEQQQSDTNQIATAMNEMSSTVQEVAMNVSNTSEAANGANLETEKGRQVVTEAVDGIQQLAGQIESAADAIAQVEQNSENISTVLDVIKGVAEQTNLLALNAAIEAARAGEQGRGFAVVADEVRTLAARTQESTAEINQIVESLQSGSRDAVQAMNESREQAKSVVEQATLAGASLITIAGSVSQIDEMSTQIATAAEEQNSVAEEMNQNIFRINDMAVQNASGAQQISQAGQELARMATELQELVGMFKLHGTTAQNESGKETVV
ncbi:MAG: methyl-accepting chemotaxis protein [Gammaproteobacteria bacterium]|nr:methyl-accepting chemotaxis protein [Gammaproteobacteria bacterium]